MSADTTGKKASLTGGTLLMTGSRVIAVAVGYALNVFLARNLGPELFGLFAVIVTVLVWVELVVAEGLPLWVVRVVGDSSGGVPRGYVVAQIAVSLALAAALALAAPALARLFADPSRQELFRVAAVDIPLFALYNLFLAVLLGSQTYGLHTMATSGYAITKLAATVLFVTFGMSVLGAVLGSIAGSLGGLAITFALLAVVLPGKAGRRSAETRTSDWDGALAGSVTPAVLLICQSLALSADLWIVMAFLPSAAGGYYRAAALVAQVPVALSAGLVWGLYAAYSAANRSGDTERMTHYLSQATRLLVVAGGLWVALVAPTAKALLETIYSSRYAEGSGLLVTLAIAMALGCVGAAIAPTLIIEGHGRYVVGVAAGLVALEIAAALVLVPRVGAAGAALAVAVTFGAATAVAVVAARQRLSFPIGATMARLLAPAAAVVALALFVRPEPGAGLLAWYAVFSAVYAGLLFLTGGVTKADLVSVREGLT